MQMVPSSQPCLKPAAHDTKLSTTHINASPSPACSNPHSPCHTWRSSMRGSSVMLTSLRVASSTQGPAKVPLASAARRASRCCTSGSSASTCDEAGRIGEDGERRGRHQFTLEAGSGRGRDCPEHSLRHFVRDRSMGTVQLDIDE